MKKHIFSNRVLAFLLSAFMLFGISFPVFAVEPEEETLNHKIEVADENATIILEKDYTEDIIVSSGKKITLDLAGHTLKGTDTLGTATIKVEKGAELTITGEGVIINNATGNGAACIFNNGSVTIENGTIKKETGNKSYYNIANHGTMVINGGTILNDTPYEAGMSHASLVENGYYDYTSTNPVLGYVEGENEANPSLTINGGTFDGGLNTIKNDDGAILVINDAVVKNEVQVAVFNVNETTINGGTFEVPSGLDKTTVFNQKYDDNQDKGQIVVKGGEFHADYFVEVINHATEMQMGEITIEGGIFDTEKELVNTENRVDITTLKISGGIFNQEPADEKLMEGVDKVQREDEKWVVGKRVSLVLQLEDNQEGVTEQYFVGEEVTLPSVEKDGYILKGWKQDDDTLYQMGDTIIMVEDLVLTAQWEEIQKEDNHSSSGHAVVSHMIRVWETEHGSVTPNGEIKVENKLSQKFTFKADKGYELDKVWVDEEEVVVKNNAYVLEKIIAPHDIRVTFKKLEEEKFDDVREEDWFKSYVDKVVEMEIMIGVSNDSFAPKESLTRGMATTILYRLTKSDAKEELSFTDVKEDAYYANAIAWAAKNKIVEGTGDNKFEPDREVTREELMTMIYRYAKLVNLTKKQVDVELEYTDQKEISAFALQPIEWCTQHKIVNGREEKKLVPKALATRAEAATMIVRLVEMIEEE